MKKYFITGIFIHLAIITFSQSALEKGLSAINEDVVKGQLEFLASDWTEGRETGARGAYMAADYIASMFKVFGIQPFGDQDYIMPSRAEIMAGARPEFFNTYFQNFSLIKYNPGNDNQLDVISYRDGSSKTIHFNYQTDYSFSSGPTAFSASAPLVFAGYGLTDDKNNYDDFEGLNIKGKIVVVLNGFPGYRDTTSEAYSKLRPRRSDPLSRRYGGDNFEYLIENGAAGLIIAAYDTPPVSWDQEDIYPVKGSYYEADKPLDSYNNYRMLLPEYSSSSDFPYFMVTKKVLDAIVDGTGLNIEKFEEEVKENMKPASRALNGKTISLKTSVNSEVVKVRNVLGYIEGEKKDEYIVVGAHYDHLGKFNGWTWNGADDNASGTVGVMTIAKAFAETGQKPEKSVIFAAWTAEEKGLYGSRYFVKDAQKKNMNIILSLNYDMIARDTEEDTAKNQASLNYTQAYPGIEELTKKNIEEYDINLDLSYKPSPRPSGGSDHAPFAAEDIPIFYFMAAMHPDYHLPSDELPKVNWEKMTNIIKIGFLNTWEFANSDQYLQKAEKVEKEGD